MESNLLLEQYSRYKKNALEHSPFKCLLNTNIELNPHQINAFCAAIQALKTGGIILADEVGLGKTIEAGLVINYVINAGAKHILIVVPATLRKQWEVELVEKFKLESTILDRLTVEKDYYGMKTWLENRQTPRIVITSYDYGSKLLKRFPNVKWDYVIIDEAHNLRNVFHGTKRAKNLFEITNGIPKLLLTATPLQNSLTDLHGLVSFIDPRIFGPEKVFNKRYVDAQNYDDLKKTLLPVLYRTLRKDIGKYMSFRKRICHTVDFQLTDNESELYTLVNNFLKRDNLYSIPAANRGLIVLVIRKLLASSSFALVDTFEVLKGRLDKLYQGTKSSKAQEGFDLFWDFVEDEIDEDGFEEVDDSETIIKKVEIMDEMSAVNQIITVASKIETNAKIDALKIALQGAFESQENNGIPQKVVIFTESKRTQLFIANELRKSGYNDDDIVLFNGDFNDVMTKEIYRTWQVKNFGKVSYGRSVEYKHAIVDYFQSHAKVLIVTDAGSEGLNLQFCNTVINYDLPWNPQKIEQRIGRCHRYGQQNDVVAINLLNTGNEADKRVYEILSKKFELFEGVFGASDIALGALESGTSFEKTILEIYQSCNSNAEFKSAFDKLNKQLDARRNKQVVKLRSILLTESPEAKGKALEKTKQDIDQYLADVEYWEHYDNPEMDNGQYYWSIDRWGQNTLGSHGTLFIGAFLNNDKFLFPVLLLCDENGEYIDFDENDLVKALETADDSDVHFFTPSETEKLLYKRIYQQLTEEMLTKYTSQVRPLMDYNQSKVENWVNVQMEQLRLQKHELEEEIESLFEQESTTKNAYEKADIMKKVIEKKKALDKFQKGFDCKVAEIQNEAKRDIEEFNGKLAINPIILVNIILKF